MPSRVSISIRLIRTIQSPFCLLLAQLGPARRRFFSQTPLGRSHKRMFVPLDRNLSRWSLCGQCDWNNSLQAFHILKLSANVSSIMCIVKSIGTTVEYEGLQLRSTELVHDGVMLPSGSLALILCGYNKMRRPRQNANPGYRHITLRPVR